MMTPDCDAHYHHCQRAIGRQVCDKCEKTLVSPPRKFPFKWEMVYDYEEVWLHRAKVIGGWLVLHVDIQGPRRSHVRSESMSFVPDPFHEWEVE